MHLFSTPENIRNIQGVEKEYREQMGKGKSSFKITKTRDEEFFVVDGIVFRIKL